MTAILEFVLWLASLVSDAIDSFRLFKEDWRRGKWSEGSVVLAVLWLFFIVMIGVGLWLILS